MMAKDREKEAGESAYLVAAYLAKGGKITVIPDGQRSDPADLKPAWGRPKAKKAEPKPE
jgi:hypothetical protein